ncbi:MAG: DUF3099 domain-containing protein [Actinobacteria bacterium]|nr:DUF3099 domain-containing protein [Actinomycetota bacterium]
MRRSRHPDVALITSAPTSPNDEYNRRRKRYALMMSARAVCVVLAALTYRFSIWLALALVVGGAVLPWCAVLIANDRPARKRRPVTPLVNVPREKALPPGRDNERTVDG